MPTPAAPVQAPRPPLRRPALSCSSRPSPRRQTACTSKTVDVPETCANSVAARSDALRRAPAGPGAGVLLALATHAPGDPALVQLVVGDEIVLLEDHRVLGRVERLDVLRAAVDGEVGGQRRAAAQL